MFFKLIFDHVFDVPIDLFYPFLLVFQQSFCLLFLDHFVLEVIVVFSDSSWCGWFWLIVVRLVIEVTLLVSETEFLRAIGYC